MAGRKWNRTFRVDDDIWARFNVVAFSRGDAVSDVLRDAIDCYLQEEKWTA